MGINLGHSALHIWSWFGHSDHMFLSCLISISGHSGHSGHSKSNRVTKKHSFHFRQRLVFLCSQFRTRLNALTTMTTMTSIDNQWLKKSYSMTTHYDQKCCTMTIKGLFYEFK